MVGIAAGTLTATAAPSHLYCSETRPSVTQESARAGRWRKVAGIPARRDVPSALWRRKTCGLRGRGIPISIGDAEDCCRYPLWNGGDSTAERSPAMAGRRTRIPGAVSGRALVAINLSLSRDTQSGAPARWGRSTRFQPWTHGEMSRSAGCAYPAGAESNALKAYAIRTCDEARKLRPCLLTAYVNSL